MKRPLALSSLRLDDALRAEARSAGSRPVVYGIETIDIVALVWFAISAAGYNAVTSLPVLYKHTISAAIQTQRLAWMRGITKRSIHSGDAILHNILSQGNAFFTSTSALAMGGLVSIVGSGERAQSFLGGLPYATKTSPVMWELKVLLLISIFAFSFFKFAWAFRLTHYASIMIGALPEPGMAPAEIAERKAAATATISGLAAEHSNAGLRSFYYAAAAMSWFLSPWLFMAATTWVVAILARRDFFSHSRKAILDSAACDAEVK